MKNKLKNVLMVACLLQGIAASAQQFQRILPYGNSRSWETDQTPFNEVGRVGIGNFPAWSFAAPNPIPSTFTIDGATVFNTHRTGDVFRTNGLLGQTTMWRMHHGGLGDNFEMGRLFNESNNIHFNILAVQPDADIVFRTGFLNLNNTSTERMRVGTRSVPFGPIQFGVGAVTISENPVEPITVPSSLLHIGFNAPFGGNNGGWRSWMDIGTYTATKSDNMYVGMKSEVTGQPINWEDNQSAVISWGNNPHPPQGPDRLRFLFTSYPGAGLGLISEGQEGLEIARMVTDGNTPKMGIGNFPISASTQGQDPDNILEIRSNVLPNTLAATNPTDVITRSGLRFTNLTSSMPVDDPINSSGKVLSVNEKGDLILVPDRGDGGIPSCIPLTANAGYNLNGNSFYFQGNGNLDKVAVGINCQALINAKLHVNNTVVANNSGTRLGGFFDNIGTDPNTNVLTSAVQGISRVTGGIQNVGGQFVARGVSNSGSTSYGVMGAGINGDRNYGGFFRAQGGDANYGIRAYAITNTTPGPVNFGGDFEATGGSVNYGVYASVSGVGTPSNVAGMFNGDIRTTAVIITASDKNLKTNIRPISSALSKLSKITPSEFSFITTTPYLSLSQGKQYGVIAQELEANFPDLVSDVIIPKVIDTTGTVVYPEQTWKGVNYIGLIPLTMQGVKELDLIISKSTLSDQQLKQNVQPLQNSLSLINQLEGVSYEWNQQVDTTLALPSGVEIGLIAQDVEQVIPEVIFTDDKGYKHVEYQKIIPHLIEANKQLRDSLLQIAALGQQVAVVQNAQIAALSQQVATLQNCLNNLPIGMNCNGNAIAKVDVSNNQNEVQQVVLESSNAAILYQNQPNPFENSTIIRYYVPEQIREAQMVFHDEFGREINKVVLSAKGYAQIEISSENLVSGVYTYSLIVDGKILDTKKMLKIK